MNNPEPESLRLSGADCSMLLELLRRIWSQPYWLVFHLDLAAMLAHACAVDTTHTIHIYY